MKLQTGSNLYTPMIGLICNLYFPVLRVSTLGSTAGADRRAGNCHPAVVGASSLPFSPLQQLCREFTEMTNIQISNLENFDLDWKQLILVVNFLFGLRVNEIPNKTFILDSHQPFICCVVSYSLPV
jgi:hypothetical protein